LLSYLILVRPLGGGTKDQGGTTISLYERVGAGYLPEKCIVAGSGLTVTVIWNGVPSRRQMAKTLRRDDVTNPRSVSSELRMRPSAGSERSWETPPRKLNPTYGLEHCLRGTTCWGVQGQIAGKDRCLFAQCRCRLSPACCCPFYNRRARTAAVDV